MVRVLEISAWGLHQRILGIMGCERLDVDDFQSESGDEQLCSHFAPSRICCSQLLDRGRRKKVEGSNPGDCLYWTNVRRNGQADLSSDRRVAQAVDCFVGESAAPPNAEKLEDVRLEDWYGRTSGSS